ncbi:MAG: hypothetical protein Q8R50_09805 [Sediminibacterium sp.]|nr:hypothetical protein [Sediminibacterium sp.]
MKRIPLIIVACFFFMALQAQRKPVATVQLLTQLEENMRNYANDIVNAPEAAERAVADSFFTRALVQALKVPYSFSYPFDSLQTISRLYAPDSSFRIITWQIMKDFTYYRQKGAIQFHTQNGSLQLIPLYDNSAFTDNPVDSVRTNEQWIGAVYYNIIQKTFNNKNYYTLLGYDENDARSTKKWIEVLSFDAKNRPLFGGRYFTYTNSAIKPAQPAYRFCLEFKKEANAKLNYDPDLDMISFAHLISENGEPGVKHTLVPYGSYEGFKWLNGKWVHVPLIQEVDPRTK